VEPARRSLSNDGRYAMEASAIHQDVFDGQPSDSHVRDLMDRAAKADGFSTDVRAGPNGSALTFAGRLTTW